MFGNSRLVAAGITLFAGLAAGACGGGSTAPPPPPPPPPPPVTITLAPSTLSLFVGESGTLTATVTNSTAAPTFTSSAPGVATVSATGVVTGVGEGNATITAAVGSVNATAQVTVTAPSLSILQITQNGAPIDPSNVQGTITVEAVLSAGANFAGAVEARMDGVVIGRTDIGPLTAMRASEGGGSELRVDSPVLVDASTQATATVNGNLVAALPNGSRSLDLVLLTPQGTELSTTMSASPLTLNNPDLVAVDQLGGAAAFVDANGVNWLRGDLQMRGSIIERGTPGSNLVSIQGRYVGTGGTFDVDLFPSSGSSGPVVTFTIPSNAPPPSGIGNFEGELQLLGATVAPPGGGPNVMLGLANTPAGSPDLPSSTIWGDNVAPDPGVPLQTQSFYVNDRWQLNDHWSANIGFRFEDDPNGPRSVIDAGSGFKSGNWRATRNGTSINNVMTGADLPETGAQDISFDLFLEDNVGNARFFPLTDPQGSPVGIGKENTPPTGAFGTGSGLFGSITVNPSTSGSWELQITDPPNPLGASSGGNPDHATIKVERFLGGTGTCVDGTGPGCDPAPLTLSNSRFQVKSEWSLQGKYRASVFPEDNAGNQGAPIDFWFFQDRVPATIVDPFAPATLTPGETAVFGATFRDDVGLLDMQGSLEFTGFQYRIGNAPFRFGDPTDPSSVVDVVGNSSFNLIRSLEGVGQGFPAPTGTIHPLGEYYTAARDVGLNVSGTTVDLAGRVPPAASSFGLTGQDWWVVFANFLNICRVAVAQCSGIPTTGNVTVQGFIPDNGNAIAITLVLLYAITPGLDGVPIAVPFGQPGTRTINNGGGFFEYLWNIPVVGTDIPRCTTALVAIGTDDNGAGLITNEIPINVFDPITDTQAFATCP